MDFSTPIFRPFRPFLLLSTLLLSFLLFFPPSESAAGNETDLLSLLAIKENIVSDPFGTLNSSWNHSLHFCSWAGVSCSLRRQRVTALNLTGLSLVGSISPHLANLTFLSRLDLSSNKLHGQIPSEIGKLIRLQSLNLSHNSIAGQIPANLTGCSKLSLIDFKYNELTGELPSELGSISSLVSIYLGNNNLAGRIPPSLGNLSSLTHLHLPSNGLEGEVPNEIGRIKSLEYFYVGGNSLSGVIPPSLYNLSSIYLFAVVDNDFEGNLPPDLGITLPKLQTFAAGMNRFTGPIPASLSNASGLLQADFGYNNFSGSVPMDLGRLKDLSFLSFAYNQLGSSGERDDLSFLSSLINCSNLEELPLGNNYFGGVLPRSIGNFSTTLTYLNLGVNQIQGSIPDEIENLVGLTELALQLNLFTGNLPTAIGKLHMLEELDFSDNRISGEIPSSIGNFSRLNKLILSGNDLHGNIPPSLGDCSFLVELGLSSNNLSGTIPSQVLSLSSLAKYLDISRNSLTGSLPFEVGQLVNLGIMDFSHNRFSGEIPSTLGACLGLENLNLGGNLFQGAIPSSFSNLKGLQYLDLSRNNLSGRIPNFLEKLSALQYLNVSFNDLEGEVPLEGIFRNESGVGILGNSKLCGGSPLLKLRACQEQSSSKKGGRSLLLKVTIPLSSVALLIICLLVIFSFLYYGRNSIKNPPSVVPTLLDNQYLNVSYTELLKATDGFSPINLIGMGSYGSVYKGILEQDNSVVAVKVLNLQHKGASKSFEAECEALRSIRHRNLVKIKTVCASIDSEGNDFKALVYEYMPNGSLERWLQPEEEKGEGPWRILNFAERLKIAIDVASALDYLHSQCEILIVHRDLKPSNVLLDDEMNARVGDFGLAKLLVDLDDEMNDRIGDFSLAKSLVDPGNFSSRSQTSTAGIKGSIGYIAPEYGMSGKPSTLGDVYSYGILVLEIFTGKRPTDDMFMDGLSLHQFAKTALRDRVKEIADPHLLSEEIESIKDHTKINDMRSRLLNCLVSVIEIGVLCSEDSPQERMAMDKVVIEMLKINDFYYGE